MNVSRLSVVQSVLRGKQNGWVVAIVEESKCEGVQKREVGGGGEGERGDT